MKNKNLLPVPAPADTYVVVNKTILNDQDRKILTMLYQPIIGANAVNLYFTLWSYLDKNEVLSCEWTHHHLMSSMQNSLEEIIEARCKLEGIGLLKTYIKKGQINNYIYEMYSPISADEFLKNPILNISLYNIIGNKEFEKTVSYFKIPKIKKTDYEEITSKFSDVFISSNKTLDQEFDNLKKVKKLGITVTPKFDLDTIISLIPDEMLNKRGITKETKELVYKLSFIYNLSDNNIEQLIRNSINESHNIDKELLKENCRSFYSFQNNGKLPGIIYKNQPEYLRKPVGDTSLKAKTIYRFETTSPYDFLYMKNHNTKPSKTDLRLIEYLLIDLKLNTGVVNVLIDYVLKINNNKLTKPYVLSIASQWKRCNIKTVEEAMDIAYREYTKKTKKTSSKKQEIKPDWFDKKIEDNIASEEQIKEFEQKLKNMK